MGKVQTSGGYRVTPSTTIHPCGFPMLTLFNGTRPLNPDSAYIVQSDGGTPYLSNNTISNYSKAYKFTRLAHYPAAQWIDVQQSNFVNWFTIGTTSSKYVLMGKLANMTAGDYRLIVKNVFTTKGEFTKTVVISEVNSLGVTNHLLGFALFAYGIGMLLIHVAICCKSRDWPLTPILIILLINKPIAYTEMVEARNYFCFIFVMRCFIYSGSGGVRLVLSCFHWGGLCGVSL